MRKIVPCFTAVLCTSLSLSLEAQPRPFPRPIRTVIPIPPIRTVIPPPVVLIDRDKCKNDKAYYDAWNNSASRGGKNACADAFKLEQDELVSQGKLITKTGIKPSNYISTAYLFGNTDTVVPVSQGIAVPIVRQPLSKNTYQGWVKYADPVRRAPRSTPYSGHPVEFKQEPAYATGFIGLAHGTNLISAVNSYNKSRYTPVFSAPIFDPRLRWNQNGIQIESCYEYAYERNFEYNQLDHQVSAKEDYLEMYNTFLQLKNTNGNFRARDNSLSLSFDQMEEQVNEYARTAPIGTPNSYLYYTPPNRFYDIIANRRLAIVNPAMYSGFGLEPYTFTTMPPVKYTEEKHTLAWHFSTGEAALAKYNADELNEMDRLQERFLDLLRTRAELTDQHFETIAPLTKCYVTASKGAQSSGVQTEKSRLHLPDTGRPPDFYLDPSKGTMRPMDFRRFVGLPPIANGGVIPSPNRLMSVPMNVMSHNNETSSNTTNDNVLGELYSVSHPYTYSTNWPLEPIPNYLYILLGKSEQLKNAGHCYVSGEKTGKIAERAEKVLNQLKVIDAELNRILARATTEGCLPGSNGDFTSKPTRCDWSPRMFTHFIRNGFSSIQQQDYKTCRKKSTSKFVPNKLGVVAVATQNCGQYAGDETGRANCVAQKWKEIHTVSTSAYNSYMTLWEETAKKYNADFSKAKAMVVSYPERGYKAIGTRRSLNPSVGDSFFGGNASLTGEMLTHFESGASNSNQLRIAGGLSALCAIEA